jgi:hypothetical protein
MQIAFYFIHGSLSFTSKAVVCLKVCFERLHVIQMFATLDIYGLYVLLNSSMLSLLISSCYPEVWAQKKAKKMDVQLNHSGSLFARLWSQFWHDRSDNNSWPDLTITLTIVTKWINSPSQIVMFRIQAFTWNLSISQVLHFMKLQKQLQVSSSRLYLIKAVTFCCVDGYCYICQEYKNSYTFDSDSMLWS